MTFHICPFFFLLQAPDLSPHMSLAFNFKICLFFCQHRRRASPPWTPDFVTQVSTLNNIYLAFKLQHEQQRVVRISSDKIQKHHALREEMASCITEISHDYNFPLTAVPLPQWHRPCGYSKGLKGHACLILVRVQGPHLITSLWEFGRLILTDLQTTCWPVDQWNRKPWETWQGFLPVGTIITVVCKVAVPTPF
jgi:hypothetical protein